MRDVCANKLTGSLIVRFDPALVSTARIFEALSENGLLDAATAPPVTALAQPQSGSPIADALVSKAVEAILERCALALIAVVI